MSARAATKIYHYVCEAEPAFPDMLCNELSQSTLSEMHVEICGGGDGEYFLGIGHRDRGGKNQRCKLPNWVDFLLCGV